MFDTLTQSFQSIFKKLRGYGKLSEKNVEDALREVRLALLEADVNYQVVKDFLARVKTQCMGEEVLNSITPGQQMIKRVHEELTKLLGGEQRVFAMNSTLVGVMLLGLNGAGKTTTAGKLAAKWKKEGKRVLLAACDIRRPAAVDQLRILSEQAGVDFIPPQPGDTVTDAGLRARNHGLRNANDIVIYDTGGRFQVDAELVQELKELHKAVQPQNTVLVLDAAIGQESVHVAETFHKEVTLTGVILTKLDGDARGGAALSVQAVTQVPILLVGTGEKAEALEPFYPDRMASRILGMGDVISMVEKAQAAFDTKQMDEMNAKLDKSTFDLEDFLQQIQQLKKLGPLENIIEMMPGQERLSGDDRRKMMNTSSRELKKTESLIQSMTPQERRKPDIINASRRRRIAAGSGLNVHDVNQLIKQFDQMRQMMGRMKKIQKKLPKMRF